MLTEVEVARTRENAYSDARAFAAGRTDDAIRREIAACRPEDATCSERTALYLRETVAELERILGQRADAREGAEVLEPHP